MTVRSLAVASIAAVVFAATLSGCSQEPPKCTLNYVAFSPSAVVIGGIKAREVIPDITVAHLGSHGLRGAAFDIYDIAHKRDLGGPPVGAPAAMYLPEGHQFRVSATMILADGSQLRCGVKTLTIPTSKGGIVPPPSPTQSASSI